MICLILLAEALLASAALCYFVSAVSWWWYLPLSVGFYVALNIVFLIFIFVWSLFLGRGANRREHPLLRRVTVSTVGWILNVLRVRVTLEGRELLPEEPVVLVSNHRSDFDPMAAMKAFSNRRLAYISKESNLHIPIAGPFVRRCWFLPIDRENPRRAIRTIKEGARLIREEGLDMGIYPEGTRTRRGGPLPFKEGAFMMAKWAEAPIVLMTTEGTEHIAGRAPLHRNHVKLRIIEVIPKETVASLSVAELTAYAERTMRDALNGV